MDDYKELIERLKECAYQTSIETQDAIMDGIDAIKILLKERDAAIRDIKMNCYTCKYADIGTHDEPCSRCVNCYGDDKNWEWRGA